MQKVEGCWLIREGEGQQMVSCYASQGRGWVRSQSGQGEARQDKRSISSSGRTLKPSLHQHKLIFSTLLQPEKKAAICWNWLAALVSSLRFLLSSRDLRTIALMFPHPTFSNIYPSYRIIMLNENKSLTVTTDTEISPQEGEFLSTA